MGHRIHSTGNNEQSRFTYLPKRDDCKLTSDTERPRFFIQRKAHKRLTCNRHDAPVAGQSRVWNVVLRSVLYEKPTARMHVLCFITAKKAPQYTTFTEEHHVTACVHSGQKWQITSSELLQYKGYQSEACRWYTSKPRRTHFAPLHPLKDGSPWDGQSESTVIWYRPQFCRQSLL